MKADELRKLTLRIPSKLQKWVKQEGKNNSRSMNGEIVELLKKAKEQAEQREETQKT